MSCVFADVLSPDGNSVVNQILIDADANPAAFGAVARVAANSAIGWVKTDGVWAGPAVVATAPTETQLVAYAAQKRYAVETGGIVVNGVSVDTARDSQSMIANAHAYVVASGAASVAYKAASGWVTLDAATVTAIAIAVGAHVQAAFALEFAIDAEIQSRTVTTTAQIDAAAWGNA